VDLDRELASESLIGTGTHRRQTLYENDYYEQFSNDLSTF